MESETKKRVAVTLMETPGCIRRGSFTLRSGKVSDLYVTMRQVFTLASAIKDVAHPLLAKILTDWPIIRCIGGPGYGGSLIVSSLMTCLAPSLGVAPASQWAGFVVRDKAKDHGVDKDRIIGHLPKGQDVVLVDDVLTSGSSLMDAIAEVRKAGCDVVAAYVVLDRQEGGKEAVLADAGVTVNSLLTKAELFSFMDAPPSGLSPLG